MERRFHVKILSVTVDNDLLLYSRARDGNQIKVDDSITRTKFISASKTLGYYFRNMLPVLSKWLPKAKSNKSASIEVEISKLSKMTIKDSKRYLDHLINNTTLESNRQSKTYYDINCLCISRRLNGKENNLVNVEIPIIRIFR